MDTQPCIQCSEVSKIGNIVETYTYDDGSVVHISDSAYRDKTPDQLKLTWELVQKAAINCMQMSASDVI